MVRIGSSPLAPCFSAAWLATAIFLDPRPQPMGGAGTKKETPRENAFMLSAH